MSIKFENVVLASLEQMKFIIEGMRNPMNSWEKSDSHTCRQDGSFCMECKYKNDYCLGENDHSLMQRLSNAGTEHRKYMRMMPVYVRITAPLYWWKEFDTYKIGTVANSCSTMHKIAEKEFTLEDFSCEHLGVFIPAEKNDGVEDYKNLWIASLEETIDYLNVARTFYNRETDPKIKKDYWWQLIQLLPSSYNQTRNVMMNYEVLANIYRQRKNHKLDEWREFCKWIESLPYSELITDQGVDYCRKTLGCLSPMLEPGYAYAQNECINSVVGQISDQISKDALVEMTEMSDDTDRDTLPKKAIFGSPMGQGGKYDI